MIVLAVIVVAVLLGAPSRAAPPTPPALPTLPLASASSEPGPAVAAPTQPQITNLLAQGSLGDVVDMVPGKPPSLRYPAGTMFIGDVVGQEGERPKAKLYEWDVAGSAVVEERAVALDDSNGKIDPGTPHAIRLAKDGDDVIAVVEAKGGASALHAEGWVHSTGARASIAGERGLVAVAYYVGSSQALEVELFHPSFYGADVLGHARTCSIAASSSSCLLAISAPSAPSSGRATSTPTRSRCTGAGCSRPEA